MTLNLWSSVLYLQCEEIMGLYLHAQFYGVFGNELGASYVLGNPLLNYIIALLILLDNILLIISMI